MPGPQSLGDGWSRTLHPEDRAEVFNQWRAAAAQGLPFDMNFRVRHDDGGVRQVRSVARRVLAADGELAAFVGVVEDVTDRLAQQRRLADERHRLAAIIEGTDAGTWEWNVPSGETRFNERWARIVGWSLAELQPTTLQTWAALCHPEDLARAQALLQQHLADDTRAYECELRMRHRDGHWVWVLDRGRVLSRTADGQPEWMFGTHLDITERRRQQVALEEARDQLTQQHELLRVTLQSIGDAVITTDADGRVTWLNPVAERMTGWSSAEALGRPLSQVFHIVHEETRAPSENPVATCLRQGQVAGLAQRTVLISRTGPEYGVEDSASPIRSESGQLLGAVLVFHDVTEQRRLSGEMSYRATHDALTGLANRAEFEARLRRTLHKAHEDRSEHALMYIDLDQFKLVNDACGHSVGDQLLQQVARLFGEAVRARDTLARLGGDEFAVILEHCTAEQAQRVAQQVCDRMDDFRFIHDGRRFRIGASVGLVPLDSRWSTAAALMQAADTSCYAAKEAGRNRVHTWFDTDQAMRGRHGEMQWATRLEQSLDEDRFELHAQRIESLRGTAGGLHAEVLLRLRDADGIQVPPGAFLPAAERFNLCARIDHWVLRHTIDSLQRLPSLDGLELLTVNLSGQSIGDRAFHRHVIELLQTAGPGLCRRLGLEITETVAITNMADAAVFIDQVRVLGVRVALDDFGAGASSFGYLKTLGVDLIKIDGQFIRDLIDDPLDAAERAQPAE
jgi:diguanylate cyclase (GGDEF)-like protein/PAS domain S-box-containing protein